MDIENGPTSSLPLLSSTRDLRSSSVPLLRRQNHRSKYPPQNSSHPRQLHTPYWAFTINTTTTSKDTSADLFDPYNVVLLEASSFFPPRDPPLQYLHSEYYDRRAGSISSLTLTGSIRPWTKQDRFRERYFDVWPLDPPHHRGRRRRGYEALAYEKRIGRSKEIERWARKGYETDVAVEAEAEDGNWNGGRNNVNIDGEARKQCLKEGSSEDFRGKGCVDGSLAVNGTGEDREDEEDVEWELLSRPISRTGPTICTIPHVTLDGGEVSYMDPINGWELLGSDVDSDGRYGAGSSCDL